MTLTVKEHEAKERSAFWYMQGYKDGVKDTVEALGKGLKEK